MLRKEYITPALTVVSFRNERGYASSIIEAIGTPLQDQIELMFMMEADDNGSYHETEVFSEHDVWTQETDGFFL